MCVPLAKIRVFSFSSSLLFFWSFVLFFLYSVVVVYDFVVTVHRKQCSICLIYFVVFFISTSWGEVYYKQLSLKLDLHELLLGCYYETTRTLSSDQNPIKNGLSVAPSSKYRSMIFESFSSLETHLNQANFRENRCL